MKCAKCQTENEREALYCKMCGTSMSGCAGEAASAFVEAKPVMLDPVPESAPAVAAVAATIATSYPHTESAADFARYQRKLADKAEQVRDAREVAALNAADHEVYRRRRRNCLVVGIVLAVLFAMMYPSWTGSFAVGVGEDPMRSLASHAVLFSLGAFNAFFFPFGFTPIKNFIVNNGFFVVAGWLFLALAALLLVMLSMLFGVPYAIWLSWKVRKSRKATEEAVEFAQMAELEYQHM